MQNTSRIFQDDGFLLEDYYHKISEFTSQTYFIPLSLNQAKAVNKLYRERINSKQFNEEDLQHIRAIQDNIRKLLKNKHISQFFIRLSYRSPKDGTPFEIRNLEQSYKVLISQQVTWFGKTQISEQQMLNLKIRSYFRLMDKHLLCRNQKDALNLLITSERVAKDTNMVRQFIEKQKNENLWNVNISIRKWNNRINGEKEFRCFVKNKTMRAISQYNHYILIEDYRDQNLCKKIKTMIYQYWKHVSPKLQYLQSYIIDIGILDVEKQELCIIQLNPYFKTTGASLFLWNQQFLNEQHYQDDIESVQFRIRTEYINSMQAIVQMNEQQILSIKNEENYLQLIERISQQRKFKKSSKCMIQ